MVVMLGDGRRPRVGVGAAPLALPHRRLLAPVVRWRVDPSLHCSSGLSWGYCRCDVSSGARESGLICGEELAGLVGCWWDLAHFRYGGQLDGSNRFLCEPAAWPTVLDRSTGAEPAEAMPDEPPAPRSPVLNLVRHGRPC